MSTAENQKKAPWWGWAFVTFCGAIPVVALGGAIPAALGCGGASLCYAISRDGKGSAPRRVFLCSLVSVTCWAAFVGIAMLVIGAVKPKVQQVSSSGITRTITRTGPARETEIVKISATAAKVLSDEEKREIYAKVAKSRAMVTSKQLEINQRKREGKSTDFQEKQLEHSKGMYEKSLVFSTKWNKISRQELEAIIREGDRNYWAQE